MEGVALLMMYAGFLVGSIWLELAATKS